MSNGAVGASSLADLVKRLDAPRTVWLMLPAGEITQQTIDRLAKVLDRDDTIVDGGNTKWTEDKLRAGSSKKVASTTSTWAPPGGCGASKSATA